MKFVALCIILGVISFNSYSNSRDELVIASFIEPPFVALKNHRLIGSNIEVAKLLARAVNLKPVFVRCPFARCLSMVKAGKADMIFGLRKTPEREKELIFLSPPLMIQHYPLRFFTLAKRKLKIDKFDDLLPLTVGILRGATHFEAFDNNKKIHKFDVTTRKQLVSMLLKGRIDTFADREESIKPLLSPKAYQTELALANYQYDQAEESYIAISKKSHIHQYATQLTQSLQQLSNDGTIEKIMTAREQFIRN